MNINDIDKEILIKLKERLLDYTNEEIKAAIDSRINMLQKENLSEEKYLRIKEELAVLISNQKIDFENTEKYWREVIENGKK